MVVLDVDVGAAVVRMWVRLCHVARVGVVIDGNLGLVITLVATVVLDHWGHHIHDPFK